ncbi:S8 family serine peptidase [Nonomuraea sp. NPDC050536]|uniref:S8 family serine peptidase n=1 Tax=Nonomuraea sp. NPDC050536 TaxID=3364366 RepID=UPI0037C712C1
MTTVGQGSRRTIRFAHTSMGAQADAGALGFTYPITRDWAWGGSTGRGVRVCIIDSGLDAEHPAVGGRAEQYCVRQEIVDGIEGWSVVPDAEGDSAGHGTACAGIIRSLAPDCDLVSVRVLGKNLQGNGEALMAALKWAIEQRFPVVNLSLSTRRQVFKERLHDMAEEAYFSGVTIVSSAHNRPVNSFPWRFSSVISVGSHGRSEPGYIEVNPTPPVEFFAAGVDIETARPGGGTSRVSGNSFATPHIAGWCARILQRHPSFRTAQLKHVLAAVADNLT